MKILEDKKIIALIVILVVFTLGYFIIINKASYAFETDINANGLYDRTIATIEKSAVTYGERNISKFLEQETDIIYITVQDLINEGLLIPNEEGNIDNPLKANELLNSNMIKIKYKDKKISVEVDS